MQMTLQMSETLTIHCNVSAISKKSCSLAFCKSSNERFFTNSVGFIKFFLSERFGFDAKKCLNYVTINFEIQAVLCLHLGKQPYKQKTVLLEEIFMAK